LFLLYKNAIKKRKGGKRMERYCEQEKNCLRVYVPRELDHHEADRLKQEAVR